MWQLRRHPSAAQSRCAESLQRARLLPAQVDIAQASNDPVRSTRAMDELARMAANWPGGALQAAAETALGVASLMEADYPGAARQLRQASRLG